MTPNTKRAENFFFHAVRSEHESNAPRGHAPHQLFGILLVFWCDGQIVRRCGRGDQGKGVGTARHLCENGRHFAGVVAIARCCWLVNAVILLCSQ